MQTRHLPFCILLFMREILFLMHLSAMSLLMNFQAVWHSHSAELITDFTSCRKQPSQKARTILQVSRATFIIIIHSHHIPVTDTLMYIMTRPICLKTVLIATELIKLRTTGSSSTNSIPRNTSTITQETVMIQITTSTLPTNTVQLKIPTVQFMV